MATWDSLSTYVNTHYKVSEQNDGMIALDFVVGNGRGQRVWLLSLIHI